MQLLFFSVSVFRPLLLVSPEGMHRAVPRRFRAASLLLLLLEFYARRPPELPLVRLVRALAGQLLSVTLQDLTFNDGDARVKDVKKKDVDWRKYYEESKAVKKGAKKGGKA